MKRTVMQLLIKLLLATRLMVFCEEKNIEFLRTRNDSELSSSQMLFNPKSHIEKFADSWRFYAKANDIAQREKLKMALRDALHSIERPEKHSSINNNLSSANRVKQAVVLLKEFKRMYSLSDAVKRTLGAYQKAKNKLRSQGSLVSENVMPESKLGGITSKRDIIPIYNHGSVDTPELKLEEPVILRRTSKISVKASPLSNGDVGVEYSSIDPQYSNIQQAERAVRAAKIILTYSGARKKTTDSISEYLYGKMKYSNPASDANRKSIFPAPRRHWDGEERGLSKIVRDNSPAEGRSGVSSLIESLVNGDDDLSAEDKAAIESLGSNKLESDSSVGSNTKASKNSKKQVVNQYVGQLKKLYSRYLKIKEENDTVENALQFQNEIINSNLGNASRDIIGNLTIVGTNELVENAVNKSREEERIADMKEDVKPVVKSIDDDITANRQEDTLKELKEARLAKARYEVAKQDLAHKIKELYILANNYEKDETENQILEVKNLISHTPPGKEAAIPGAHGIHVSPIPALEPTTNNITERDDVHPGLGLSVTSHRGFAKSSISSKTSDENKASSKENVERKEHQVEEASVKKQYEYLNLPPKHKAAKKEESDKGGKNDDETLNIIAQALKEDMKNVEKMDNEEQGDKDKKKDKGGNSEENKEHTEGASEDTKALEKTNGGDTGKLQEDISPTAEDHTEKNDTAQEKEKDKDNKGEESKDVASKFEDKGDHSDNSSKDDKHKQINILTDAKEDPDTKHALPQHYNESVDEYLTKALQEIISADTSNNNQATQDQTANKDLSAPAISPNPAAANWPEENDIDDNTVNPTEHNKNVVENAMKQHARNPNLPLPLVDTKGDKIKLNPAINATVPEGEALVSSTPAPATTSSSTTPDATTTPRISDLAQTPVQESMQPIAATKPEPKPIQQPTAVLLHATEKNVSTALPDIDLHDPENKQLLDKASHMEESIAAAQDKLYSEAEMKLGVSDIETHNKGTSPVETKESDKEHKEDPFSRNTMTTSQDVVKPVATSFASVAKVPGSTDISSQSFPYYQHKIDPYGSINEKVQGIDHINDVEDPVIDEGAEDEEEPMTHRRHHRHHHHRRHHHRRHHHLDDDDDDLAPEPDAAEDDDDEEDDPAADDAPDDDDDDDDDDDADKEKKSKIKYVNGKADKRSFNSTAKYNTTVTGSDESTLTNSEAPEAPVHIEELEDEKRSDIPTYPKKKSEVSTAKSESKKRNCKG